ncbi:hypothetical protein ONZ45_g1855 [Pleurotus djamor]|nr:hypothetical protein ONZ45_g1855 [Pleurotus djamor]
MPSLSLHTLLTVVTVAFGVTVGLKKLWSRRLPLPPGPKASWIGNVSLPRVRQWEVYADEWKKTYGDLIYVHVFGNPLLILNSAEAVNDLFDKRSAIYSSRPVRTMVVELMGWDWLFSSFPYGSWWRQHRAMFHRHFNVNCTHLYRPIQLKETHALLRNLLGDSANFRDNIRSWGAAIVLNISYGHQVSEKGDEYVALADRALTGLQTAGLFGTYLVDYVPALKYVPAWMPGAGFQRQAREWRRHTVEMATQPFGMVRRWMNDGAASESFVATELDEENVEEEKATIVKNVGATIYAAGADTTVSSVLSLILAMALYPDVAKKAQSEIDRVTGGRLPQFSDELPYILLRWHPVTPMGLARTVSEDDEYRGYRIPKGTTVLPNVWGILHDETTYPDPLVFNPDRFADPAANEAAGINPVPDAAFGFGRRMCPGRWLAFQSIWIAVASILTVYDILPPLDEEGRVVQLREEYTPTLLRYALDL